MSTESAPANKPRTLLVLLAATAAIGLVLDQVTKALAVRDLSDGTVVQLVGGWLSLRLLRNSGAAFSLGSGSTWIFTIAAVVAVVVIIYMSRRVGSLVWALAFGLLLAGALGNLIDRAVRTPGFGRGHVVDFIAYNSWFVGNVADIWIVVAGVTITILVLRGISPDGSRGTDEAVDGKQG